MPALSSELKKEILLLSVKEKDKLLLRLVAKDSLLIDQLEFQLIEEGLTIESRRQELQDELDKIYQQQLNYKQYLLPVIKEKSAKIAMHLKVTKDKYGEVDLLLNLLVDPFDMKPHLFSELTYNNEKLCIYLVKRTIYLLKKYKAIDEELKLDFLGRVNSLLKHLNTTAAQYYAFEYGLPKEIEL